MKPLNKEYSMISPNDFVRAEEHVETLLSPEEVKYEGTTDSYKKIDRINPVYYIERQDGNGAVKAVIDGWKYVVLAINTGIEKIYACKLTIENSDDVVKIIVQLQRSNHDSYMALFKMIMRLWPIHFKGQGYRSDLDETELDKPIENTDGSKPLDIYEKIGREINLTGTKVKHIRKVGMVNPLFFERIEISRFTLYAAYLECKKEENGEMPDAPSVKAPVYITSSTETPEFSQPTTSNDNVNEPETKKVTGHETTRVDTHEIQSSNESEFIVVLGICKSCGQETEITINKNQLK